VAVAEKKSLLADGILNSPDTLQGGLQLVGKGS
jgi:hypothetical protein